MSKIDEVFKEAFNNFEPYEGGSESDIKQYGRKMWNAALEWAADNAEADVSFGGDWGSSVSIVDKESILKGKL